LIRTITIRPAKRGVLELTPHPDPLLPPDAHRASAAAAENAGASLFPVEPPAIEPGAADSDPSNSGGIEIEIHDHARPEPGPASQRCSAFRTDGRPCRATAQKNLATCIFHDPNRAAAGTMARRLGGQHRRRVRTAAQEFDFAGLGDAEAIGKLLEIAAIDALNLDSSIGRVRLLIATALAAMRHLEITDITARLATLEVAYRAGGLLPETTPVEIHATEPYLPELDE
jgi:hypothetical protein